VNYIIHKLISNPKKTFELRNSEYHFFNIYFGLHILEDIFNPKLVSGLCNNIYIYIYI